MDQGEIYVVSARRVQNYIDCNTPLPAGHRVQNCVRCGVEVAISAGAAAKIDARRAAGGVAVAICTACMLLHVPKIGALEITKSGDEILDRNPELTTGVRARDVLTELLNRIDK